MNRKSTLYKFRQYLQIPLAAGILCSLLVFLARPFGQEAVLAFRRLIDRSVSRNDALFDYASSSAETANNIHAFQAWAGWTLYGLVTGLIAMWVTRWLARGPVSWTAIFIVLLVWIGIYLLFWRWDNELQFALGRASTGAGQKWGAWPYTGSVGYFAGFIIALVLAATPWRVRNKA